jgi:hypothetical protein
VLGIGGRESDGDGPDLRVDGVERLACAKRRERRGEKKRKKTNRHVSRLDQCHPHHHQPDEVEMRLATFSVSICHDGEGDKEGEENRNRELPAVMRTLRVSRVRPGIQGREKYDRMKCGAM